MAPAAETLALHRSLACSELGWRPGVEFADGMAELAGVR
jgi:hypothetical protein